MSQPRTGPVPRIRMRVPHSAAGVGVGTGILTTDGELPVEFLSPGDRVITHDRGALRLTRLVRRRVPASMLLRVTPAILDPQTDARPFLISARQKIVLRGWQAKAMFGKRTALVEAGRLVEGAYIAPIEGDAPVTLFQLGFDDAQHVIPLGGGALLAVSADMPAVQRA